jgi:putative ATP-dependent endonuclease of the OLD family
MFPGAGNGGPASANHLQPLSKRAKFVKAAGSLEGEHRFCQREQWPGITAVERYSKMRPVSKNALHRRCEHGLEALSKAGLSFGGFADDEGKHPTRWNRLSQKLGLLLFRWQDGCLEENILAALRDDQLEALLIDPEGLKTGIRLRTLQERLGTPEKDFPTLQAAAGAGLRSIILSAALGEVPADKTTDKKHYQSHSQNWFKTVDGGRELATKVFAFGIWGKLKPQLLPFCNAIRSAIELEGIADLSL